MSIERVILDHVAVAVESWHQAWPRYATDLGAEWSSGGQGVGFAPHQLRFRNGARLEVLQPWDVDTNPFLRRFLDSNGPGPHHLTFKVPDITRAIDEATAAGFTPVAIDLSDPGWMEAFLHPRQASGIVVQLAQAAGSWQSPAPEGFPTDRTRNIPASLRHATHAVSDLDAGLALFAGLLGGRTGQPFSGAGWTSVTVRWEGPLALRLVAPEGDRSPLSRFLDGRSGRVHHLAFAVASNGSETRLDDEVGVAPDEVVVAEVTPEENLGTRLLLLDDAEPAGATGGGSQHR